MTAPEPLEMRPPSRIAYLPWIALRTFSGAAGELDEGFAAPVRVCLSGSHDAKDGPATAPYRRAQEHGRTAKRIAPPRLRRQASEGEDFPMMSLPPTATLAFTVTNSATRPWPTSPGPPSG